MEDTSKLKALKSHDPPLTGEPEPVKAKLEVIKQKAKVLIRKKDLLDLIMSYPMKPEVAFDPSVLQSWFSQLNWYLKSSDASSKEIPMNWYSMILTLFGEIENELASGLMTYLPPGIIENIHDLLEADSVSDTCLALRTEPELTPSTSSKSEKATRQDEILLPTPQEMSNLAIDLAIRQVSNHIKIGRSKMIGISGSGGREVSRAFANLPEIKKMFDFVVTISVSQHYTIAEVQKDIDVQVSEICGRNDISAPGAPNILLLVDCIAEQVDLHDLEIPPHGLVVLTTLLQKAYQIMEVDLEIRMEDHLLPWELFCKNVGQVIVRSSVDLQHIAVRLVQKCHGHLVAIILLARALKDVTDVGVWELALHELAAQQLSSLLVEDTSEVMVHVLRFIWARKDIITKHCIKKCCTLHTKGTQFLKESLISHWIADGLIEARQQGEDILEDLTNSFLLENVGKHSVRMREETSLVLLNEYIPHLREISLKKVGLELTKIPKVEDWDVKEIHLMNNKLFELPESPECPFLTALFLQMNYDLMVIPPLFFVHMPVLQVLDLSYTSIKYLPQSISSLVALKEFFLRGCELFIELPCQIGALRNLEVFDLEGTGLIYLPEEIGELINLTSLKLSFYGHANCYRDSRQIVTMIPRGTLLNLSQLNELSIDVNPDDEKWIADVQYIVEELRELRRLKTLKLYLPAVELLNKIRWYPRGVHSAVSFFRFIVGRHDQRIISHLPPEVEERFEKMGRCIKYINGEYVPTEIKGALKRANAFFLDRHWIVKELSEFGNENMTKLEFCLLVECNELQTVIDGGEFESVVNQNELVFRSLQYLGIYRMKNLESIWKGPIAKGCLSNLKSLALHTCPSLTTVFTLGLIRNLINLKMLTVEDCPKINSLVSGGSSCLESDRFLPSLEKISLVDLPELVSISSVLFIAPKLESMIIYNCPKLGSLSPKEMSSKELKVIKGECEWWDTLKWHESEWISGQPDYLVRIFVPLRSDEDLMDQLVENESSRFLNSQNTGETLVASLNVDEEEEDTEVVSGSSIGKKKVVFQLDLSNDKAKQKAMKMVSGVSGVESVAMDLKNKKLTVIGDIDPVLVVSKLRKLCYTEIITVGPAKGPKWKKDEPKVEFYPVPPIPSYYVVEENVKDCVIC